jgi:putative transposase
MTLGAFLVSGQCRDERLNENLFVTIEHARLALEQWHVDDNHARPHSSLGNLTPEAYARKHRVGPTTAPETLTLSVVEI